MQKQLTILLAARGEEQLETRALVLSEGGYVPVKTSGLAQAMALVGAIRPDGLLIGHSFTDAEQETLASAVLKFQPEVRILRLRGTIVDPNRLLSACDACFRSPSHKAQPCILDGDDGGKIHPWAASDAESKSSSTSPVTEIADRSVQSKAC